jgi:hypothetical protein
VDFIGFAIGLYLILPLSFGPITLSSARIFGLVMVALAPFSILLLNSVELKSIKSKSAPIVLFVFLLMTSGFVSATMTHDVSPNPIIDGERIQEDGSRNEKFAYYRSSVPFSTITTSAFIRENIPANSIVEKSRLTRYRPQFIGEVSAEQVRFERLDRSPVPPGNFIFISKSDINTNTITQQWLGFVYYEYHSISSYPSTNKVYTTGNDRVLHA